ncbi:MAG: hypothetical protein ACLTZM_02550 [Ruminococcus sp.]
MFLEINNLEESFGTGESRVHRRSLKESSFQEEGENHVLLGAHPVPVNRHC